MRVVDEHAVEDDRDSFLKREGVDGGRDGEEDVDWEGVDGVGAEWRRRWRRRRMKAKMKDRPLFVVDIGDELASFTQ